MFSTLDSGLGPSWLLIPVPSITPRRLLQEWHYVSVLEKQDLLFTASLVDCHYYVGTMWPGYFRYWWGPDRKKRTPRTSSLKDLDVVTGRESPLQPHDLVEMVGAAQSGPGRQNQDRSGGGGPGGECGPTEQALGAGEGGQGPAWAVPCGRRCALPVPRDGTDLGGAVVRGFQQFWVGGPERHWAAEGPRKESGRSSSRPAAASPPPARFCCKTPSLSRRREPRPESPRAGNAVAITTEAVDLRIGRPSAFRKWAWPRSPW